MNYYNEIKNKLIDNEVYKKVKDYSKNRNNLVLIMQQVNYFMNQEINMEKELLKNIQKDQLQKSVETIMKEHLEE